MSFAPPFRVAAAQAAPVFLDRAATVAKACDLIGEAGRAGAKLVVFPEAFIPGYPDWIWVVPNHDGRLLNDLYTRLLRNAVTIPDDSTDRLGAAAREAGIHVAIGLHEINAEASGGSLYNTLLFLDDQGEILGRHRKLMPTGAERLVWAQGDGSSLRTYDTALGRLGGLICWENFMPLARQMLYAAGVQILVTPTWDKSDSWLNSLRHIAREGGTYVVNCCMALRMDDVPAELSFPALYPSGREWINPGRSCVIHPSGEVVAGPVEAKEELLIAEIDLADIAAAKRMFDVAGHYARNDVFQFGLRSHLGSGEPGPGPRG